MAKVPASGQVTRALKTARKEVKAALMRINEEAAKHLARGHYSKAEDLVGLAKAVKAFEKEFGRIQAEWVNLRPNARGPTPAQAPLWEFYRPISRALLSLGEEATTPQVIEAVRPLLGEMGDSEERWIQKVRRAKRAMTTEGFLQPKSGRYWQLTDSGKRLATRADA